MYIQVKKLLFFRTITVMDDNSICKRILRNRANEYNNDRNKGRINECDGPIFGILNNSAEVGLFNICMHMVFNDHNYSKEDWKKIVWENVWKKEDEDVCILYKQSNRKKNWLFDIIEKPYYLT